MVKTSSFAQRVLLLVQVAKSRRAFARLIGNSDMTVSMWEEGSVPFQKTMERICERTGVSLAWLRDGRGPDDKELQKFRERLNNSESRVTDSVLAEEAPTYTTRPHTSEEMECPLHLPPATGAEIALEHAAANMDSAALADLVKKTVKDGRIGREERYRMAKRLTAVLAHKLAEEAPQEQKTHGKS